MMTPVLTESHEFRWDAESIVLAEQPQTAVYLSPQNQIVIRQLAGALCDDDPLVLFEPHCVPTLIAALEAAMRDANAIRGADNA
jgi:hypothetical protein